MVGEQEHLKVIVGTPTTRPATEEIQFEGTIILTEKNVEKFIDALEELCFLYSVDNRWRFTFK